LLSDSCRTVAPALGAPDREHPCQSVVPRTAGPEGPAVTDPMAAEGGLWPRARSPPGEPYLNLTVTILVTDLIVEVPAYLKRYLTALRILAEYENLPVTLEVFTRPRYVHERPLLYER